MWNMFKVNNKGSYSSVSIVNFENVIAGWVPRQDFSLKLTFLIPWYAHVKNVNLLGKTGESR